MEFDSITKRHFGDSYDSCSESYDSYDSYGESYDSYDSCSESYDSYDSYGESYDSYDSCSESIDSSKLNEYELFIRHVVSTNFSEEANVSNSNIIYIPYS